MEYCYNAPINQILFQFFNVFFVNIFTKPSLKLSKENYVCKSIGNFKFIHLQKFFSGLLESYEQFYKVHQ